MQSATCTQGRGAGQGLRTLEPLAALQEQIPRRMDQLEAMEDLFKQRCLAVEFSSLSDLFFSRQERQDRQVKALLLKNGLRTRDSLAIFAFLARDPVHPLRGAAKWRRAAAVAIAFQSATCTLEELEDRF